MEYLAPKSMNKIAPLFDGWNETPIWSCLQGYMGRAWADHIQNPQSAQIVIGDLCFFAGVPDMALVKHIPADVSAPNILMFPQTEGWEMLLEQVYKSNAQRLTRYAFKKDPGVFDFDKLRAYVKKLPAEYYIQPIDEKMYHRTKAESWSQDLCSQFPAYADYEKHGLGYVTLYNDKIVCGASSYTVYDKGIEIQIDTLEEFRRKGLALACSAKLVLECLARGLYPSWDSANTASMSLGQKLGYHFDREYTAYLVSDYR